MKNKLSLFIVFTMLLGMLPIIGVQATASESESLNIPMNFTDSANELASFRLYKEDLSTIDDIIYADDGRISDTGNVVFTVPVDGLTGIYNYTATSSSGEEITNVISIGDTDDGSAYYVVDEDFTLIEPDLADVQNWSWDIIEAGGNVVYTGAGRPFYLNDTSIGERVVLKRTFESLDNSTVAVEYRTKIDSLADGYGVGLYSGDNEALAISTVGSALYCGDTKLSDINAATEYGIRIMFNMKFKTADIYINGSKKASGIIVKQTAIDNIRAFTPSAATGIMEFAPVRIMRGYNVAEQFISYIPNQTIASNDIWKSNTAGGEVKIVKTYGAPDWDLYNLQMTDRSTSAGVSFSRDIDTVSGTRVFAFKLYSQPETAINGFDITLGDFVATISSGVFKVKDKNGTYTDIKTLPANLWNSIRVTANFEAGTATIQVNGKEVAENFAFAASGASAESLIFKTGDSTQDTIWLDDIYLSKAQEIDEYYPEEPATLTKSESDVLVGIQVCDIWREGKHMGWEKLNRYPSRKPFLGFYDEGSPEVADWEIKYMVEHGIDFAVHCWYRGNQDWAIKEPRNSYGLNDGYFNAKYKDKIKFAIAWENNTTTESDFKENIVPYWIEYYFSDPNYMTVDNKALLNFYKFHRFIDSFADEAEAKTMIDYLNEQVIANTDLDGVYVIGTTDTAASETLASYKAAGCDAIYCYSYGHEGFTLEKQWENINIQRNNDTGLSYIPTITMGRDNSPWYKEAGGFITPDALQELCQRVKDEFFPDGATGTALGDRMVVLDNWNEYAEGHFFMPSNLAGFEYLEAVGSVFGMPEHKDEKPQDVARLGHLYDVERTIASAEGDIEWWGLHNIVLGEVDFSGGQGYFWQDSYNNGFEASNIDKNFKAADGAITGTVTGTGTDTDSPQIYSPTLNISLTGKDVIHIKFKNASPATSTKIYFKTAADSKWDEAKAVTYPVPANMTAAEDFYIDMSFNDSWTGTLTALRLDPFYATGSFEYNKIEVLSYDETAVILPGFSAVFSGIYADGTLIEEMPAVATSVEAKFNIVNPDYEIDCIAFAAEYDGNGMTAVRFADDKLIELGESTITVPITINPGKTYKFGLWNSKFVPIIRANEFGQ